MAIISISFKELCESFIECDRNVDALCQSIQCSPRNLTEEQAVVCMKKFSKTFLPRFNKRWQEAHRKKQRFFQINSEWLKSVFEVGVEEETDTPTSSKPRRGRPQKPFEDCGERAKRYKVQQLCDTEDEEKIARAATKQAKKTEMKSSALSNEQALALLTDLQLTKHQYERIRTVLKEIGCNVFPSYGKVLDSKQSCYPNDIIVTEKGATIPLQGILDHTAERLLRSKLEEVHEITETDLTMICKWGCDGASGQNEYKQCFHSDADITDANLFMVSMVPLQIIFKGEEKRVFWSNPKPSSTRYCRPIKFEFAKETREVTIAEVTAIENQIHQLKAMEVTIDEHQFKITYDLHFTMHDAKVAQAVTGTSSASRCYICAATPKEMNNLTNIIQKPLLERSLQLGLSTLHARIKFMECLLHIAYRIPFQKWAAATLEEKQIRDNMKKRIQEQFRNRLGIRVDFVKQGVGTSNDGNTARKFFSQPQVTADITGIDVTLIERFSVILQVITSSASIHANKFGIYARETAELYVQKYNWYHMPVTVHKVLMHGEAIIEKAALPIGLLSEEAQEAQNKNYKKYRLHHSRKISRLTTNEDVVHMLLLSSDPFISNLRQLPSKKAFELHEDAKALLKDTDI